MDRARVVRLAQAARDVLVGAGAVWAARVARADALLGRKQTVVARVSGRRS